MHAMVGSAVKSNASMHGQAIVHPNLMDISITALPQWEVTAAVLLRLPHSPDGVPSRATPLPVLHHHGSGEAQLPYEAQVPCEASGIWTPPC